MPRRQRTPSPSGSLFSSSEGQATAVPKHKKYRHAFTPSSSTEGSSSNQPDGDLFFRHELTLLREEKNGLKDKLEKLETSTEVRRVKLLEGEVKKLRGLLDRMNEKAKGLEEEIKDLKELVDVQEGKIAEVETLQEEVEELGFMNKLMWRRWKDCLNSHPEIEHEYI